MKFVTLFLGLALGCTALLFVCGDFTPYAGEPDRDIEISWPNPGRQLVSAAAVASVFAAFAALLASWRGTLLPRFGLLRLFVVTGAGLSAVIYVYGNFKMLLGVGPTCLVHYELPWGPERLLISTACGAGLASIAVVAAWANTWKRNHDTGI